MGTCFSLLFLLPFYSSLLRHLTFGLPSFPCSSFHHAQLDVHAMDWSLRSTYSPGNFDLVLGCDLIYDAALAPLLVTCVDALLSPDGVFLYSFGGKR